MLPWSAHISMLYAEHPYPERPGLARAPVSAGWSRTGRPTAEDRDALASATTEHGLRVALVNTDGGDMTAGERGQLCDPALEELARARFLTGVELAARVGARSMHALVGVVPDGLPSASRGSRRGDAARARARGDRARRGGRHRGAEPARRARIPHAVARDGVAPRRDPSARASCSTRTTCSAWVATPPPRRARSPARSGTCTSPTRRGAVRRARASLDLWGFLEAVEATGYDGPAGLEYDAEGDTPGSLRFLG